VTTLLDVAVGMEPGDVLTYRNGHGQEFTACVLEVGDAWVRVLRPSWAALGFGPEVLDLRERYELVRVHDGGCRIYKPGGADGNERYCARCYWSVAHHGEQLECPPPGFQPCNCGVPSCAARPGHCGAYKS
jgi:hypothetical protein